MEEHKGRGLRNYNVTCKLCGEEKEDIVHFIIKCKSLEVKRDYNLIHKEIAEHEERMRELLYRNKNHSGVGKMIKNLWDLRKNILDEQKKNTVNNPPQKGLATGQSINPTPSGYIIVKNKTQIHH